LELGRIIFEGIVWYSEVKSIRSDIVKMLYAVNLPVHRQNIAYIQADSREKTKEEKTNSSIAYIKLKQIM